jgi:hypothetical protein
MVWLLYDPRDEGLSVDREALALEPFRAFSSSPGGCGGAPSALTVP